MRQLNHVFPTLVGDVMDGVKAGERREGGVTIQMTVSSSIREPVFWRNALGIEVVEAPAMGTHEDEFVYITFTYSFSGGVRVDTRSLLKDLHVPDNHVEKKRIAERLHAMEKEPRWVSKRQFHYTLGISRQRLLDAGGVVYLNDVDLIIGFERHRHEALHPYSIEGQIQRVNDTLQPLDGVTQRFIIIDTANQFGPRWINTGYSVYELTPVVDPSLKDGVYVTTSNNSARGPISQWYSFEEANEKLGLYRSAVEAEHFGDPKSRAQQALHEKEEALNQSKLDLQQEKIEFEREKQQQAREAERLNRFKEEMESYRKIDEERNEMRKQDRKDRNDRWKATLDLAKTASSVVGVGLSVYLLYQKQKDKDSK
jgi:hypothetical protein